MHMNVYTRMCGACNCILCEKFGDYDLFIVINLKVSS